MTTSLTLPCPACGGIVSAMSDGKAVCGACGKAWKTAAAFYGSGYTDHEYKAACIVVGTDGRAITRTEIADTLDHELLARRYLRELAKVI